MRVVIWEGVGFGLTSGVITTLGVIVGLDAGTHSKLAVLAGILVMAVADALSDAMGMHVSAEAEMEHTTREQWETAFFTFISKLVFTLSFIVPFILFDVQLAILISIGWGLFTTLLFSSEMAKAQGQNLVKLLIQPVTITLLVVLLTYYIGDSVYRLWGYK
jgi:VIT1/CCC1 family predicted Fe2+/Mn2+ transporter